MNYSTQDDTTLIRLVALAQTDAFGELYDRYNRLVFSVAVVMVGDRASAAEITLDVFTQVWQRAATYRAEQAKVSTWLTAITRYQAIDVLRRRNSRPESNSVSWDEASSEVALVPHELEEGVELALQRERVRQAVAKLPVDQRQALALAFFKGYTHPQIAEALDQPLGTIKTRIRLAMQKLRNILQDEESSFDTSENASVAYRIDKE
jgi:RNA polymerase sigma-70 factor (ECF subfamily)